MNMPAGHDLLRLATDHVWQSTWCGAAASGLAWVVRKGEARIRHGLWLAASLKFLVPFALLSWIGQQFGFRHGSILPQTAQVDLILQVGQALSVPGAVVAAHGPAEHWFGWLVLIAGLWGAGAITVLSSWLLQWRRVHALAGCAEGVAEGREANALRQAERAMRCKRPVVLRVSRKCMEPGIYGMFRPVLLWPEGISAHLDDAQLAAIMAHEVCHVVRRDNLLAALHMVVEMLFWFHPLVWWMGARLVEERERACDEAVLNMGNDPGQYAEGILKACRFCMESPLACVSGVSGSDLKRRMVRIMNAGTVPLSRSCKWLLASTAVAAIAVPIAIGAWRPQPVQADSSADAAPPSAKFDSASLTPSTSGSNGNFLLMVHDNEFVDKGATVKDLIAVAFGVTPDRIVGGPDWVGTQHFDFEAHWTPTAATTSSVPPPPSTSFMAQRQGGSDQLALPPSIPASGVLQAMMRNYLAEHLNLKVKADTSVLPVYELTVANGGAKLAPANHADLPPDAHGVALTQVRADVSDAQQRFVINGAPARALVNLLSTQLGRQVVDKTGLAGRYDIQLSLPNQASSEQVATALRDQLGLDLQSSNEPMKVFAIDQIQSPASN